MFNKDFWHGILSSFFSLRMLPFPEDFQRIGYMVDLLLNRQISQEACQVVWYSHLFKNFPWFLVIHTVKGFAIVNKAEVDIFLELSCFFSDPTNVGNLISGSSAFSKSSLNIWKLTVHILLKTGLENVEHYFASMWDECNCAVVWMLLQSRVWKWSVASQLIFTELNDI